MTLSRRAVSVMLNVMCDLCLSWMRIAGLSREQYLRKTSSSFAHHPHFYVSLFLCSRGEKVLVTFARYLWTLPECWQSQ